ncbi:hypothetical protein WA026_009349 [Henosepilachna vigintioctopunctata]|uniref:Uncharacterized protein n=1 Tax=Henosepilachna vigintioctopunctata TaxID=420089 RepID=A0AAW1U4R0_9CUCU
MESFGKFTFANKFYLNKINLKCLLKISCRQKEYFGENSEERELKNYWKNIPNIINTIKELRNQDFLLSQIPRLVLG